MRLIDADALMKYFEGLAVSLENVECFAAADAIQTAAETLKLAPTIDAEPVRHGRWIDMRESHKDVPHIRCSECKSVIYGLESRYCPNCGAKMDLEVQDD